MREKERLVQLLRRDGDNISTKGTFMCQCVPTDLCTCVTVGVTGLWA